MYRTMISLIVALPLISCSETNQSLDCDADPDHVVCDTENGSICDPVYHRCMCADSQNGSCPCISHSQCQSLVCAFSNESISSNPHSRALGTCVPRNQIVYLNIDPSYQKDPSCANSTSGSQGCPYTDFQSALASVSAGKPYIQFSGTLATKLSIISGNYSYLSSGSGVTLNIIGSHDQYISDFWEGTGRPADSVLAQGIEIVQSSSKDMFNTVFDGIQVYNSVTLTSADDKFSVPSVLFTRSIISDPVKPPATGPQKRLFDDNFNLVIDKSIISTSAETVFLRKASQSSIKTTITNTVFRKPTNSTSVTGNLFGDYYEKDSLDFLYNSVLIPSIKTGRCTNQFAGNLFWDKFVFPDSCLKPANLDYLNGVPVKPQATDLQELIEVHGCHRPYLISEGNSLQINRPIPKELIAISRNIQWDYCGRQRDTLSDAMGALVIP